MSILFSNYSNPNPLWLDEDLVSASRYNRFSKDLNKNMFGSELVKLCSAQDLIICNGLKKWQTSSRMNCIHGLGSSVVDYSWKKVVSLIMSFLISLSIMQ